MTISEHYVHFSSASGAGCNNIVVEPLRHAHLKVHLGFLQIYHRYHVEFTVPWNTCVNQTESRPAEPAKSIAVPNSNCQIINLTQDRNDILRLKVELLAKNQGLLKEELQIKCCDSGQPLTIHLSARIFGKDQGTPILRSDSSRSCFGSNESFKNPFNDVFDWSGNCANENPHH
ncbi:hypothetical protein QAD02_020092 [Eretmocerus hayati]|uniref:Uncharacterized protein n=1 Tax=Eretmocerus hayati TaxID=131215 RepID=A0ACC2PR82_9HYME|nr:hypothetical protein QAD02_020092 [Eretmocerus hayati]